MQILLAIAAKYINPFATSLSLELSFGVIIMDLNDHITLPLYILINC